MNVIAFSPGAQRAASLASLHPHTHRPIRRKRARARLAAAEATLNAYTTAESVVAVLEQQLAALPAGAPLVGPLRKHVFALSGLVFLAQHAANCDVQAAAVDAAGGPVLDIATDF